MDDGTTKQEQAAQVRAFVEELRGIPYLNEDELNHLLDKYEAFLKKTYGDNCHQIRFLRRISFFTTTGNTKERLKLRKWYGGLNDLIDLSNTLLEEFDSEPPEVPVEYEEPEADEDEEEDLAEEVFPTREAAEIARKIQEIEAEEARKKKEAAVKEKENIRETPADLKELEKRVDSIADVLTFIFNGFAWFLKGSWKVLRRLIVAPEKLFAEWKEKIAASMEYKPIEETEQPEGGE